MHSTSILCFVASLPPLVLWQDFVLVLCTLLILLLSFALHYTTDFAYSRASPHEPFKHIHATLIQRLFPEWPFCEILSFRNADAPPNAFEFDATAGYIFGMMISSVL